MINTANISANQGGIAAGGNIIGNTFISGVSPDQLVAIIGAATRPLEQEAAEQRTTIAAIREELGVSHAALAAFFGALGQGEVPPQMLGRKLVEIAHHYKRLEAGLAEASTDDGDIASLRAEAKEALKAGGFERADQLLARIVAAQQVALDRRQIEIAATMAQRGRLALTQLRYLEAARHFADAARWVPVDHAQRLSYLDNEAAAYYAQGSEYGDNASIGVAIDLRRSIAVQTSRERVPLEWAKAQNRLGNALLVLAEREADPARLEEAATAYRAALLEWTHEHDPLDWAGAQNNLANVLATLGDRDGGTARLEDAVEAYRAVLLEWTRERVPLDWAMTQNNLGTALATLGERTDGTGPLEEAVLAYRAALLERTRERVPLGWATTQNNLAAALKTLGERKGSAALLEEAVGVYRQALFERRPDRAPLDWAATQSNLGAALAKLAEYGDRTARLEEAVAAHRAALLEWTQERVPLSWATAQNNLGTALARLGHCQQGVGRLEEAVAAFRAALLERTRERVPLDWAMTTCNLGRTLTILGECELSPERLDEAASAFRGAIEVAEHFADTRLLETARPWLMRARRLPDGPTGTLASSSSAADSRGDSESLPKSD